MWRRLPSVRAPIGLAPSQGGTLSGANTPIVRAKLGRPRAERQQQKLEIDRFAVGALCRHAGDCAGAFVGQDREQAGDDRLARRGPEIEEGFPFDLAAEQRADPRAGKANRMPGAAVEPRG